MFTHIYTQTDADHEQQENSTALLEFRGNSESASNKA